MLIPWLSALDFQNLLSLRHKPLETNQEVFKDYTIIVPIFKDPNYLKNLEYLKKYKDRVVICTVQNESAQMNSFVEKMRNEGFVVLGIELPSSKFFKEALLKEVLAKESMLKSKYVCFLDADSIPEDDVGKVCQVMEEQSLDLASLNVIPRCNSNFIEKMQKTEYSISMVSRQYRPWLTSGACVVGKSSVLSEIMEKHSLYFAGGDIEMGVIAKRSHKKVGFVNFKVFTEVPKSFKGWFKQRMDWFCGSFRLSVINADKQLWAPFFLFYTSIMVFLLLPLKFFSFSIDALLLICLTLLLYIGITLVSNWKVRSKNMLIYPFYAAFQVLIFPFLGIARYIWVLKKYKMTGRMKK